MFQGPSFLVFVLNFRGVQNPVILVALYLRHSGDPYELISIKECHRGFELDQIVQNLGRLDVFGGSTNIT